MTSSSQPDLDEAPLAQLEQLLKEPEPRRRLEALRALGKRRGYSAVGLIHGATQDRDPNVRQMAVDMKAQAIEATELFGAGELLRIDLPPRLPTVEEERRISRQMWIAWFVGGMLTVTALLVREHTGMTVLPVVGAFLITLAMFVVSARLRKGPRSPGWLFIDPKQRELILEREQEDGNIAGRRYSFSAVEGLERSSVPLPATQDEAPGQVYELSLRFTDGDRVLLARRDDPARLERTCDVLKEYLPARDLPPAH